MKNEFVMTQIVFTQYGNQQKMFFENMYPLEARRQWDFMYARTENPKIQVVSVGLIDEYDWAAHQDEVRKKY